MSTSAKYQNYKRNKTYFYSSITFLSLSVKIWIFINIRQSSDDMNEGVHYLLISSNIDTISVTHHDDTNQQQFSIDQTR